MLLTMFFMDRVGTLVSGTAAEVLDGLSLNTHFLDFSKGVVDTSHVAYYLSVVAVFLFLTVQSLETRRWR